MGSLILSVLIGVVVVVVVTCEDCYAYRLKENVTMDTSDCLFVNSAEPLTMYECLDSCTNNSMVRIAFITTTVTSPFLIEDGPIISKTT